MSDDAYARAGVSQSVADEAVAALVQALGDRGSGGDQLIESGHYANVIRVGDELGIAISTDGVGTKLLVAEQLGRWDTIGIDCIAMNVNDIICVGARPVAMVDYLAVDRADPEVARQIGEGLRRGAELAGISIPGGELAQLGELIRGLDLAGACFGVVHPDRLVTGREIRPGDAIVGVPSSGLHSNGYTLARNALEGISLDDERLGRPLGEVLLEPTTIYVRAVMELLREDLAVHGLAHITSGGLGNLLRLDAEVKYVIEQGERLPAPPIFDLIAERGGVDAGEMDMVFNMGCGFCCVVGEADVERAVAILDRHHPGSARIGAVAAAASRELRVD